ncbi:hypothetical protein DV515_00007517, partial [Chloebia gouldiae]
RRPQLLKGLPATSTVEENSAAGVAVYNFSVTASPSEGVAIHPIIVKSNPLTKAFDIEPKGGLEFRVITTGNPVLDYETMPKSFDLQIFVEDTTGRTDLNILTIQVTDKNEHPVFQGKMAIQNNTESYIHAAVTIYVMERKPPERIYQVDAADPENAKLKIRVTKDLLSGFCRLFAWCMTLCNFPCSTRQGMNGGMFKDKKTNFSFSSFQYSLLPATAPFSIRESGAIFSMKEFDYEKDPHCYFLDVTVTDPDGLNSTRTLKINIININDESPYFTTKQRIYRIPEEQSPGTIVANITAKDPDDEDSPSRLFYSIQSSNRHFSINPATGVLQVTGRIDRDALPLRLHPNISLTVRVEDGPSSGRASEMEITIVIDDVNDNPPQCHPSAFRKEVNENTAPGTVLVELRNYCKDIDADPSNNQFIFTGLSGFGSNNFALKSTVSGRLVMAGTIDLENPPNPGVEVYTLTVRVQDIAHPNYSSKYPFYFSFHSFLCYIIYIYIRIKPVNEFFPVFHNLSYVFSVSEITKVGSSIGRVHAIDKDWPPNVITYSIVAGAGTRDYTNIFWISPTKGVVKILARLDYETTQKHIFTVQASDQEKSTTASVTVNVLEVNDEEPVCSPNFFSLQIPVNLAVGTNINGFRIECQDRDSDPRSFRYFIKEGNENNHFIFSPSAGSNTSHLILASRFDYESGLDTNWIYSLRVHITDDNLVSARDKTTRFIKTGTVTLNIRVIPNPTTATTTTPGIAVVTRRENRYSPRAWINAPEKKKPKKEVVVTMTKLNTVFDGEARDPVTGRMYEFNTRSGARRWKKSNEPPQPMLAMQVMSSATESSGQGVDRAEAPSKKEHPEKRKELTAATKPATKPSAGQSETPGQVGLRLQKKKEESEDGGISSPAP